MKVKVSLKEDKEILLLNQNRNETIHEIIIEKVKQDIKSCNDNNDSYMNWIIECLNESLTPGPNARERKCKIK